MAKRIAHTTKLDIELAAVIDRFAHTKNSGSAFDIYSNGERRSKQKATGRYQQQTVLASVASALKSK